MLNKEAKEELVSAKAKHYLFKNKLRSYLQDPQEKDEASLVDYNICGLGKWINDIGKKRFSSFPQLNELDLIHQSIHVAAKAIVELRKKGEQEKAELKFSEISEIGNKIVKKIDELHAVMEDAGN